MTITKNYAHETPEDIDLIDLKDMQSLVKKKKKQFSVYVNVTPVIAEELLNKHNSNNRNISNPQLQKYVRDMKEGRWNINQVDNIAIDNKGNIADGQHRLAAIKESGVTVPTVIVFGVTEDYKLIQGKGRTKSLADTLAITGTKKYASEISASITMMYAFSKNPRKPRSLIANQTPSDSEKMDFYNNNRESIDASFKKVLELGVKNNNRIITPATAATVHWVLSHSSHGKAKANEFMEKLIIGSELKANDPIMITRNRIINNSSNIAKQPRRDDMLGLIFSAYNDWVSGNTWTTGKHSPQGKDIPNISGLKKLAGIELYGTATTKKSTKATKKTAKKT